ncbi:hypothetical protein CCR75_003800 [Bremia lactucae]|uniref:General transcription and DNA repair factor IIH subunit TFB5 n=1 Tax=Bremia lactucae TaxID=4779 RepID=A0A976IDR0_BRELC|nr:hypothetical protein CCR75_003800 [Bremia lactucae]
MHYSRPCQLQTRVYWSNGNAANFDAATKQYLLHLNETAVQHRFVIEDLDDTHLFIVPDPKIIAFIEKKMDEWNEKNTYQPPTQ